IDPDDLRQCTLNIHHSVQVPVTNINEVNVIQHIRCTGETTWHGQPARYDWVWVETENPPNDQQSSYGALHGHLPYPLLMFFKLSVNGKTFLCAFVEKTTPKSGHVPESASGMVRVTKPTTESDYTVI
ncbi:hypothetical protein BZA05DRAFT_314232, partial [Tricharina praecox]|uniref:uncharacterized protein n=1 Tax=Tricharina praecox TaxID=43433 RepID=UPI0022202862